MFVGKRRNLIGATIQHCARARTTSFIAPMGSLRLPTNMAPISCVTSCEKGLYIGLPGHCSPFQRSPAKRQLISQRQHAQNKADTRKSKELDTPPVQRVSPGSGTSTSKDTVRDVGSKRKEKRKRNARKSPHPPPKNEIQEKTERHSPPPTPKTRKGKE